MMSENETKEETKEEIKESKKPQLKNRKRAAAGKKGVEARKIKAELKRKEAEQLKKRKYTLIIIFILNINNFT